MSRAGRRFLSQLRDDWVVGRWWRVLSLRGSLRTRLLNTSRTFGNTLLYINCFLDLRRGRLGLSGTPNGDDDRRKVGEAEAMISDVLQGTQYRRTYMISPPRPNTTSSDRQTERCRLTWPALPKLNVSLSWKPESCQRYNLDGVSRVINIPLFAEGPWQ